MSTKVMMYVDGEFGIKNDEVIYRGTVRDVKTAALALGIPSEEFEAGVFDLESTGPNVSYFGINGSYLYSERQL